MDLHIKPIVEPNGSQSLYWLVFPDGSIKTPIVVISDYEMQKFVERYSDLHEVKIVSGVELDALLEVENSLRDELKRLFKTPNVLQWLRETEGRPSSDALRRQVEAVSRLESVRGGKADR